MPFVRYADRNILFIHIPRTGGTAVEHWLGGLGELRLVSRTFPPKAARVTPQHLRLADIDELLGREFFDYVFTIVRNPFTRIASEYRMRCALATNPARGAPHFPNWLENQLERLGSNPFHLDNHLRPQWEFAGERVRVFRYENGLENEIARIADEIGAPPPASLAPRPPRDQGEQKVRFETADMARILAVYGRDFEQFGYSTTPPAEA